MMDLLPLDPGDWVADSSASMAPRGEGVLVVALPGDDAWVAQLHAAATSLPGVPLLVHAPGRPARAVARDAGIPVEPVGWQDGLVRAMAYIDAGPARLACEARQAGLAVVWHPRELKSLAPSPAPLPGRVAQALYLVDQMRRQREQIALWVGGDAELAAAIGTLPGVTPGVLDPCAPLLDVAILTAGTATPAGLAERLAPGALLLLDEADGIPPGFEALGTGGWQVLRRSSGTASPLRTPIRRVLVHFHARPQAGARYVARALARLGYEVLVAGEGQAAFGGHELPSGAALPTFLEALDPKDQPELYIFLASPGDQPPAGLHHLELPAIGCFLSPAQRRGDMEAARDFDHVGIANPMGAKELLAQGHRGSFVLPRTSRMNLFDAVEQGYSEERAQLVDDAHRMRVIGLLTRVQTTPSRGLALLAGHQHFAIGDLAGAIRCFEAAAQDDRPSAEALVNLGACVHALGQLDDAIMLFKAALALDPGQTGARDNLAALGVAARPAPAPI